MGKRIASILTLLLTIGLVLFAGAPYASSGLDIDEIRKAAEQGDADAQYQLGVMYGKGDGVSQNSVTAYAWLRLAAVQGDKGAAKSLGLIDNNFTPDQRNRAEALASALELQVKIDTPMKRTSPMHLLSSTSPPVAAKQTELQAWVDSVKPAAGHIEPVHQESRYWKKSVWPSNRRNLQEY